ncbi:hypothetical protein C0075_09510 [Rhizobium sp. KAs_5_22]|uniref:hypothetical protein n=1 Tax=Ciceribacter selenitireducens TaxID=448181 RepID=UPI00048C0E66|nr:hypothetical protein [Ciceribacter selenitireducens]PPJ45942.1 hypothetical protein C0075_09510 [Rhizobium sp. KAs_5_22]
MTIAQIEIEVGRFLSSDTPEVLCIKGKWGVGKTFGWNKFLDDNNARGLLALKQYSYVSLFGLNSLEDLKYAIFEKTTSGNDINTGANSSTFLKLLEKSSTLGRRFRPIAEGAAALFNRKGVADVLFKSAFLAVQEQLICIDDLERSGDALKVRDVLGLASFLKLERRCKVVLLLNDEEHPEKDEFLRQLEKVADVTLTFDPTSQEACKIGLCTDDPLTALLQPRIIELCITNIRVIKKIETLARRLTEVLNESSNGIIEQAVSTIALAGWSVYQPKSSPPLDFIRNYNRTALSLRAKKDEIDADTAKWRAILNAYPFHSADELDLVIIDGVAAGFFNNESLREKAEAVSRQRRFNSRDTAFSRAWDKLYHGSLATSDDEFLDALHRSAVDEADAISALNINSAIRLLRECGRAEQADEVIQKWFSVHSNEQLEFFNIANHHFSTEDHIDDGLRAAFEDRRRNYQDYRDPFQVLQKIARQQSWREADVALLAKCSASDFERMFEELRGNDVRMAIDIICRLGQSGKEGSETIGAASLEALRRIAGKSTLRARKIGRFGIEL